MVTSNVLLAPRNMLVKRFSFKVHVNYNFTELSTLSFVQPTAPDVIHTTITTAPKSLQSGSQNFSGR